MDVRELVKALVGYDTLAARQWVADARKSRLCWPEIPRPSGLDPIEMAVAAGAVEMLAQRQGQQPPGWTSEVPALREPVYLVRAAASMPRLRRLCRQQGPESLRRRGILAPPEFLTMA